MPWLTELMLLYLTCDDIRLSPKNLSLQAREALCKTVVLSPTC